MQTEGWKPLTSSNLRACRYDADTCDLFICFTSGAIYQYSRVPPEVYAELLAAPSKGSYRHTAKKRFACTKLPDSPR